MLLLSLISVISAINVGIDGKGQRCFFFDVKAKQTARIDFVVTGVNEKENSVVLSHGKSEIDHRTLLSEGVLKHTPEDDKELNVCFTVLGSYYATFSFDIDIEGVDKNYAKTGSMSEAENLLERTFRKMHRVYRNQQFQFDREHVHQECIYKAYSQVLQSTEKKLKWSSLFKIIVLFVVCLVQVYMLTNFFKDKSFGPSV